LQHWGKTYEWQTIGFAFIRKKVLRAENMSLSGYQTIRISELMPRDSVALRKKCKDGIVVRSRCDNYSSQALLTLRLLDAIVMVVMMAPVVAASFRNTPVTLV
jgi:hypothetical protein